MRFYLRLLLTLPELPKTPWKVPNLGKNVSDNILLLKEINKSSEGLSDLLTRAPIVTDITSDGD